MANTRKGDDRRDACSCNSLQPDSILPAARGIMTTDLYPKVRSVEIPCANGTTGRLVGIAKGAGMVEPNMATMLVSF